MVIKMKSDLTHIRIIRNAFAHRAEQKLNQERHNNMLCEIITLVSSNPLYERMQQSLNEKIAEYPDNDLFSKMSEGLINFMASTAVILTSLRLSTYVNQPGKINKRADLTFTGQSI